MNQPLDPREIAFRQFWTTYPRKMAVAEARVAFANAIRSHAVADILAGAHRYAMDPNRDETYTVYPAKWLNNIGWMDDPLPPRKLTPQEIEELEMTKSRTRQERENAKNKAIEDAFKAARDSAVPMPESVKQLRDKLKYKLDI